jgi:hypothetical protein
LHNESNILEIVQWWEKRRWIYNFFILIPILFLGMVSLDSFTHLGDFLIVVIIWVLGANVFYTMGWALEILMYTYYGKIVYNSTVRIALFWVGTVFSMIWTYLGF